MIRQEKITSRTLKVWPVILGITPRLPLLHGVQGDSVSFAVFEIADKTVFAD